MPTMTDEKQTEPGAGAVIDDAVTERRVAVEDNRAADDAAAIDTRAMPPGPVGWAEPPGAAPSSGWRTDPLGRHELRYYVGIDGDPTELVRDGGVDGRAGQPGRPAQNARSSRSADWPNNVNGVARMSA